MKEKTFARKTELLEAALEEFCEKSYEDASLNTILKNAGISKGTFYYHFADKQALYLFLLDASIKAKWDFINEKAPEHAAPGESIFEQFRLQAKLGAEFALKYPQFHKLGRMLAKEQGTSIYKIAKDHLGSDTEDLFGKMVDAALVNGDFKSGYSRDFLIKILTYLFSGFDEVFHAEQDFELNKMLKNLDMYVDFIQNGLGNQKEVL